MKSDMIIATAMVQGAAKKNSKNNNIGGKSTPEGATIQLVLGLGVNKQ